MAWALSRSNLWSLSKDNGFFLACPLYTRGGSYLAETKGSFMMQPSSLHTSSTFYRLFQKNRAPKRVYFADESSTRRISDASPVATLALNTHCFWDSGNVPFFVPKVGWETKFNSGVKLDWVQHFPLFSLLFLPVPILGWFIQYTLDIVTSLCHWGWGRYRQRSRYVKGL